MSSYKLINFVQWAKDHPYSFRLVLMYVPCSRARAKFQGDSSTGPPPNLPDSISVVLPHAFVLMVLSQLQILITEKFGELVIETSLKTGKCPRIQVNAGTSYVDHVRIQALERIIQWCRQVYTAHHCND